MESPRHTCLKLEVPSSSEPDQTETLFVKGTWFFSCFDLSITNGLDAWTCNASEEEVSERASHWEQPISEYIDLAERYLGFQQPGSIYGFSDVGNGDRRFSWTFEKEGTKLEWYWKCQPSSNKKKTTAGILDFLMDANIRLSDEVVRNTPLFERLDVEAEKCVAQSEKAEFEVVTYAKADVSTRDDMVVSESVMDSSSEFTTNEIFKSREALVQWTREVGKRNGFVIVIKTSDVGGHGKRPRVTFACERSGYYRKTSKNMVIHQEKRPRTGGSKKCGCPFLLKGQKLASDDDWILEVISGVHNHSIGEHLEGHSYAGRLSREETSLLVDLSKSLVRPKEILNTLKQRDAFNVTTMKTIYNARHKHKVTKKAGRSQTQLQLMDVLVDGSSCSAHSDQLPIVSSPVCEMMESIHSSYSTFQDDSLF